MKQEQDPSCGANTALVKELDDIALRSGHALLDSTRSHEFSDWIDAHLRHLEEQFAAFWTCQSVRRSLGR